MYVKNVVQNLLLLEEEMVHSIVVVNLWNLKNRLLKFIPEVMSNESAWKEISLFSMRY
jgi:hypothetical protein